MTAPPTGRRLDTEGADPYTPRVRTPGPSRLRPLLVAGALLAAGCPADLGRFTIAGEKSGGDDGGSSGGGGDGGVPTTARCGGGPYLLALMTSNDSTVKSAQVLRIPLDQAAKPKRCSPIDAGGTIDPFNTTSLAWLPPDEVAVGSIEGIQIIDSTNVQVGLYKPGDTGFEGTFPVVIAPVADGAGKRWLAVAYNHTNTDPSESAQHVEVVDLATFKKAHDWGCDATWSYTPHDLLLDGSDSITGMVQSPYAPTHLLFSSSFSPPDAVIDALAPFDDMPVKGTVLVGAPGTGSIRTLHADRVRPGLVRYAWVLKSFSSGDFVYVGSDASSDGGAPMVRGPIACHDPLCKQVYTDAIADPTDDKKVIEICDDAMSMSATPLRHIVRTDGATCEVLVDGHEFTFPQYATMLALAGLP